MAPTLYSLYSCLLSLLVVATCVNTTCLTDVTDDVTTRTLRSSLVFEGRIVHVNVNPVRHVTGSKHSNHVTGQVVVLRVRTVFKGVLENSVTSYHNVTSSDTYRSVAVLWTTDHDVTGNDDDVITVCAPVLVGAQYVVFLGDRVSSVPHYDVTSGGRRQRRAIDLYRMSSEPEVVSADVRKQVQRYSGSQSVKSPVARLRRVENQLLTLNIGDRFQLNCRTSGRPTPHVTWFKDGDHIAVPSSDNRIVVKELRRGSLLRVKRAELHDSGVYSCVATNAVGQSQSQTTQVLVQTVVTSPAPDKSHSILCTQHTFCLNGGTCYLLSPGQLDHAYCVCRVGFHGTRCSEKSLPTDVDLPAGQQRLPQH